MCAAIVNNFLPNSPSTESLKSPEVEQNLFAPDNDIDTGLCNGDLDGFSNGVPIKSLLVCPDENTYDFLLAQLKHKLEEGQGETIYTIGEGDGADSGLSSSDLAASVASLQSMATQLGADMVLLRERTIQSGSLAEYLVRMKADDQDFYEIRVAVVGNVDAGKSTLLGVLTHGELDNGRGFARQKLFRHKHEMESGRTSSVGNDILGFDSCGKVVNKTDSHGSGLDWTKICQASSKVITFIDLAGHERYLKTTVFGMTGHAPDFCMLMIGSNAGIVGMTKEHLGLALALSVPVFVVVTKIDMCPPNVLQETLKLLQGILKSPGCRKIPVLVNNNDDVVVTATNFSSERVCPIFQISNVSGENLGLLKMFLNLLSTRMESNITAPAEFQIDDTYSVPGVGTVVSGTTLKGIIRLNDTMLLGPDALGQFIPIAVKSIHRKRLPVKSVRGGQTASFALKKIKRSHIRKGMVMVSPAVQPKACWEFEGEILVLHHPTTISPRYQAMVHCGSIRQTATIIFMSKDHLRTGDKASVRFRFIKNPEYIKPDTRMVFREGRTKAVGSITKIFPHVVATAQTARQKPHKMRHQQLPGSAGAATAPLDDAEGRSGRGRSRGRGRGRRRHHNHAGNATLSSLIPPALSSIDTTGATSSSVTIAAAAPSTTAATSSIATRQSSSTTATQQSSSTTATTQQSSSTTATTQQSSSTTAIASTTATQQSPSTTAPS